MQQSQQQQQRPVFSVAKTLSKLISISSNRSCAECRSTLVDPSQIYASVSPHLPDEAPTTKGSCGTFRLNHRKFAPPTSTGDAADRQRSGQERQRKVPSVRDPPMDPAMMAPVRVGSGHGVLVCALCAAAHKLLGPSVAVVNAVQDVQSWTPADVQRLALAGGNARAWVVFERYLPPHWESKRPKGDSSVVDRLTFIRAKYQALAFVLPHPGPLAFDSWRRIVNMHPEWKGLWGANLESACSPEYDLVQQRHHRSSTYQTFQNLSPEQQQRLAYGSDGRGGYDNTSFRGASVSSTETTTRRCALPDRLVDYFCVVTPSDYVDPFQVTRDLSTLEAPEDVLLVPKVSDCFPHPSTHENDHEFPEHVSTFLFPDGCRASSMSMPPSFFTFVLTASNGERLYGGVLRLYDDHRDVNYLRTSLESSGYTGKLPDWLLTDSENWNPRTSQSSRTDSLTSDVIYLPKCLVVISHYPFFDLWRKFLLQIYRIALVEAPLPIERFISNFTCEIPLPPPGKIVVKFGYTVKDTWRLERPPENQLPMADFSFKPLFASLSISNVMVVFSCLLQETRVALVSRYNAILGPVAEALTSLLFPFHWEGMYLPVMPYSMLDILDAPVPYLVGLHSRYLKEIPPSRRPHGVVFVDLDRDVVHLGYDDDDSSPRTIPHLPDRHATKLRRCLEDFAESQYVLPPSGKSGTVTNGEGYDIPHASRPPYFSNGGVPGVAGVVDIRRTSSGPDGTSNHVHKSRRMRREVFGTADKAYREQDLHVPITGFLSEHGQFFAREAPISSNISKGSGEKRVFKLLRSSSHHSLMSVEETSAAQEDVLLEINDVRFYMNALFVVLSTATEQYVLILFLFYQPPGFSTTEIRRGFLRFFVSLFRDYRQYLGENAFHIEDFVASLNISASSSEFVVRMLKTQMFMRFVEDRRDSPEDPEVKFFDESINAKINRSKKASFGTLFARPGKHKRDTSFLDDNSGLVRLLWVWLRASIETSALRID